MTDISGCFMAVNALSETTNREESHEDALEPFTPLKGSEAETVTFQTDPPSEEAERTGVLPENCSKTPLQHSPNGLRFSESLVS